ncbi:Hypothetical predicted protein [Paramuricea clavata]|uniref:Uncharacterized protein n=1 Tax=Paramuricea clavata TaxID=317549 RepID=A0A7D9E9T4_PARCT|nr:Hypothetical predicted protein [Paramuricea clavata]
MFIRKQKNNFTSLIRNAKQNYFKDKFSEHKNNSSKLWNLIKCLSKDGGENKSGISHIVENKVVITDSTSIAEIFNRYFIDIPTKYLASLAEYQGLTDVSFETSINFAILPITENDVLELLMSVPSHKATGDDGIGIKILMTAAPAIVPSLTRVLNLCLTKKHFPKAWKIANVSLFLKEMEAETIKNAFGQYQYPNSFETVGKTDLSFNEQISP